MAMRPCRRSTRPSARQPTRPWNAAARWRCCSAATRRGGPKYRPSPPTQSPRARRRWRPLSGISRWASPPTGRAARRHGAGTDVIAAVNYYWRMLVTGACFLLFSSGGAVGSFTVFPALRLMPGGPGERERRVRWMICRFFGVMVALLRITGVMRLETQGLERLHRASGVLGLANHPSLLDVVVLLSAMPRATCVVKDEWWANPFIAGVVNAAGYIRNSEPEQVLEDCDRALGKGAAVIVFPEGTRTRPNEPLKFLRGAAHIALKSARPI